MSIKASPSSPFSPATEVDLPRIQETIAGERLDGEDLRPHQFIVLREGERIIAFGRIKPYRKTHELGTVWVDPQRRGHGLGRQVVEELIRRFPQDDIYITTDLPPYFQKLGFLETEVAPPEIEAKISRVCASLRPHTVAMIYDRRIRQLPTLADVYKARRDIQPYLPRTPLLYSPPLSRELGCQAYVKYENLQPIGAFKVRGGVKQISSLSEEERSRGVIAASTGNHGQSIAYAARCFGVRCVIAMPRRSNPLKVAAIEALGAQVSFHGKNFEEARAQAEDYAAKEGLRYVHHINEPLLIAGVATISLEIVEDLPDLEAIIVPIGGGSGALGHCLVAKRLRPQVEVIGVQAERAPAVYRSWKERRLVRAPIATEAEGLATGIAFYLPVRTFIDRLDDMLLVSEEEMRQAIMLLLRTTHQVAEAAGAAAIAAALKIRHRLKGKKVALILSGGNATLDGLRRILGKAR